MEVLENPVYVPPNPLMLLESLLAKGVDAANLTGLYDLAKRYREDQAAEAFGAAIQEFQRRMPPVEKVHPVKNKEGKWLYDFAKFEDIMAIAGPILADLHIVITFDFKFEATMMWTTCRVRVGSHVESTTVPLAIPQIPNANDSQKAGGATSYGKRYAMCAALNIIVKGEDVDGNGLHATLDDKQTAEINGLFEEIRKSGVHFDKAAYFRMIGCTDLNDLPAKQFELAKWALRQKMKGEKDGKPAKSF